MTLNTIDIDKLNNEGDDLDVHEELDMEELELDDELDDELEIDDTVGELEDQDIVNYTGDEIQDSPIIRKLSKTDANSFVGGDNSKDSTNKKVFSFQLPFGSNFKFKMPTLPLNIPNINLPISIFKDESDPIMDDIKLRLSRQQSVNTLDEAAFFKQYKGRGEVRMRAVKHSLTTKYNELISNSPLVSNAIPDYESIYSKFDGNIVILGGYRGSILRDTKTGKRLWIPLKAGFHLRKINLLLGPKKEDELNAPDTIYPDGVLKNIGPIDLCKSFIKKLHNGKTNVYEFGYDWRLSGDISGQKLVDYLQEIHDKSGKPTLVIAHSMGGLITHYAVQKRPDLFRSVIYCGVPSECLNILGPIRSGDAVLFSDKILTAEVNFMMRSSFIFLPLSGMVFYNRDTHEPYVLDLFDPDTWVQYNLNPLVAKDRLLKKPSTSYFSRFKSMMDSIPLRSNSSSPPTENLYKSPSSPKSQFFPRSLSPRGRSPTSKIKALASAATSTTLNSTGSSATLNNANSPPKSTTLPVSQTQPNPMGSSGSPKADDDYAITFEEAYNYLSETLTNTKKFIEGLDYRPELESKYPPMAIVYGNAVPSVRGSNVSSPQDIVEGRYWDFFYGHGDGVVHQKWLMPERKGFEVFDEDTGKGQIVGKFATKCGHVDLMTDLDVMGKALNSVYQAEKVWPQRTQLSKDM
ncbi:uncharacterized protein CLIB1444_01S08856 [[Candida] jaroonii]|uniref:Uncharacterized protein n=1 Tax=[Candida] jaroonii TaxID=467808 RepID=A0ACA9Y0R7_9ASCO|nr:uncharacterized protein CLIB1444_01S08856 [[Candida] jaroonii]